MTLPHGFTIRLTDDLLTTADGDVIVGGSPLTAMRLTPRAQRLLAERAVTVTDPATDHLARRLLSTNLASPDLDTLPSANAEQLTVVIPVRDRPEQLDRTLAALTGLSCVVVDDASHDRAAIERVCARHRATWVPLDHNVGPAAARNIGLARVTTPYVAFVDSDVQIATSDLIRLTRHFADPSIALVGPRVVGRSTAVRPRWFERYDELASSLTLGLVPSNVRPGATVAWLPGACLVARVNALGGGFDPALRVGEDVDLVWRLVEDSHGVRYDPAITAHHDTRPTMRGWLGRKFVYGRGGAGLAARHGDRLAPAVLTPTYAAAAAALLLRTPWSLPLSMAALTVGTRNVREALPVTPGRTRIAAHVSARGLGWAVRQEAALVVRHWWPATAVAATLSTHARRILVTALAVDTTVALATRRREERAVTPLQMIAGHRLDDLAYGAGLWYGSAEQRTARALMARRPRSTNSARRNRA
jgi:mycofactocin glycosyltransferase